MQSTRERIFITAAKLFRKKGYSATTVQDIASEIGIKPASLYNHIKSKQELLQEMLLEIANKFTTGMEEIQRSNLNPVEKIQNLIALHVRLTFSDKDIIALVTSEWVHLENPAKKTFIHARDQYEVEFRKVIEDCIATKRFQKVDIEIALFSILSTLRWMFLWAEKHPEYSTLDLENELKRTLIEGLILRQ